MSDWVGARWWKFDFHTHSPASDDYGKGADQARLRGISERDWLLGFMQAGIDCVAITDHNSGSWVDRLKNALDELEREGHPGYRPLFLFPGVEISVQGNIHLLGIFPFETSTEDINHLLGAVHYRGTNGKSDACTEEPAIGVVDEIIRHGGLAIPAHVDINRGMFEIYEGTTLEQVMSQNKVAAIELIDPHYPKPGHYAQKTLGWSEVLGSDSHHPINYACQNVPGSRFTWVKMAEPSIDGLRLALLDGNFATIRSDSCSYDPNSHSPQLIEGIGIKKAKYVGRREEFSCYFNPWLNTIIGGRGTGKSTIVEFIRLVLNRQDEIPDSIKDEFSRYFCAYHNREDAGLLTDDSELWILYRKDGTPYRIKWSLSSDNHVIEEMKNDTWVTSEGNVNSRFPVRIFSQKQIFELAKHPQGLLSIIDDAPEIQYRTWKQEMEGLVSNYLTTKSRVRTLLTELQEESNVRGDLKDIEKKIEVFEQAGYADILKAYSRRMRQLKAIETWERGWKSSAKQIEALISELSPPSFNPEDFSIEDENEKELVDEVAKVNKGFTSIVLELQKVVELIGIIQMDWLEKKKTLAISSMIESDKANYTALLNTLTDQGIEGPAEYSILVYKKHELDDKLKGFGEKKVELSALQSEADNWLRKIYEHRQIIRKRREDFLGEILRENSYVRISVVPFGNKETIEEEFRDLINRSNGGFERDIGCVDGDSGLLSNLNPEKFNDLGSGVESIKKTIFSIYQQKPGALDSVADRRFANHIQGLIPEQIDRLHCWFPEDTLLVEYGNRDSQKFKPIDQGSPGQKTAALLAFTLSYGDEPLILDQPEDDLDNNLIYDLIVAQLKTKKKTRQIIVVTHNANIVVNGDSENVIVLDVVSGQTLPIAKGCLQEQSIRDEICRIMEGGKEAFKNRYIRINGNY